MTFLLPEHAWAGYTQGGKNWGNSMAWRTACKFGLIAVVPLFGPPALAGVKEGVDAWQAGNYTKAIQEWRSPADKGDADAQFNLGQAYKLGRGVKQDMAAAQSWYLKAAQQGHEQAQANLGLILFQNGDRQGAIPWIRKAAERGEPRAQYVLATAMFNGDLVSRDWPRAYALMSRAAAAGLPQAGTSLLQMEQYLSPADKQAGQALAREIEKGASALEAPTHEAKTNTTPPRPAAKPAKPDQMAVRPVALPESRPQPAPAPVPTPSPVAAAPAPSAQTAGGGWKVQLGAFSSAGSAQQAWAKASSNNALRGASPIYTQAGNLTRLQAGPFPGRQQANDACAALKDSGLGCFPVAP